MHRHGKFEQHVIIQDFFANNKQVSALLTLKIGGNFPFPKSHNRGEVVQSIPWEAQTAAENGFLESICAYKIIRKLQGKFERSAVSAETSLSLPKGKVICLN